MTQNWIVAAEQYRPSGDFVFVSRRKKALSERQPSTLASFMTSGSWEAATKLLAAADCEICLGYSETVMSRTSAVIIDGEGLKCHSGVVGMAAAYTNEKPQQELIDASRAISMLVDFPPAGNMLKDHDESTLVMNIKNKLDQIATNAPEHTRG